MKTINFWTELKNRFNKSTPIFFNKLATYGAWMTATSLSLVAFNEIPGVVIPDIIPQIAGYMAVFGAAMTFVSKLPVKDPDYTTLDKKE